MILWKKLACKKPCDLTTKETLEIINIEKTVSLQKCIDDKTLSFSQLIKREIVNEKSLIEWIANYIYIFFSIYFNVSNNITPIQGIMIASELIKRADLSPDDVICFIKSIKENEGNKYGSSFNRIDPAVIMEWLMIYLGDRIDAKEQYECKKKSEFISLASERTSKTLPLAELGKRFKIR
jgi:hypothetical protein